MKFKIQGKSYEFPDLETATTGELKLLKEKTGRGLRGLAEELEDLDPDSISAVVFLAKKRAGENVDWDELDELRPFVDIEWPQVPEEEGEGQSNPPTGGSTGSGTTRKRGSSATSHSSRTTSTSPRGTSTS